jgi:hypothetical protein
MLRALVADAAFIAALFVEVLASLSLLQSVQATSLRDEFLPLLAAYHGWIAPELAAGAALVWRSAPQWYVDATALGAILFFLFCIAQARKAMAPYEPAGTLTRIEAAIDWTLPILMCAAGALLLGPTLLPLLTVPAALILGLLSLAGRPRRFELARSYYVNLLCVAAIPGVILILQH